MLYNSKYLGNNQNPFVIRCWNILDDKPNAFHGKMKNTGCYMNVPEVETQTPTTEN